MNRKKKKLKLLKKNILFKKGKTQERTKLSNPIIFLVMLLRNDIIEQKRN